MTQPHKVEHQSNPTPNPTPNKSKVASTIPSKEKKLDPLDRVRAAAQELNGAISDAIAARGEKTKQNLHALSEKTKAVATSLQASLAGESESIKQHLTEAKTFIESTEQHVAAGLKATGQEAETSFRQALSSAQSAARKVSEAVAIRRTTPAPHAKS